MLRSRAAQRIYCRTMKYFLDCQQSFCFKSDSERTLMITASSQQPQIQAPRQCEMFLLSSFGAFISLAEPSSDSMCCCLTKNMTKVNKFNHFLMFFIHLHSPTSLPLTFHLDMTEMRVEAKIRKAKFIRDSCGGQKLRSDMSKATRICYCKSAQWE